MLRMLLTSLTATKTYCWHVFSGAQKFGRANRSALRRILWPVKSTKISRVNANDVPQKGSTRTQM